VITNGPHSHNWSGLGHGEPVRLAVVGLGYWGPNLVRNLVELPEATVACVCDINREALYAIRRRYPGLPHTTRFEDVLHNDDIDAVALATSVSTHYRLGMAALSAGKHVFIEKPLAMSSLEALDLLALAEGEGLVLMPGHTFLYSPPVDKVMELISTGALGDIYFISTSRVNLGLHQSDVSVAWDLGPHDFSMLRYWLGEMPTEIAAMSRGCIIRGKSDVAFVNLLFRSGTIAHVELSWLAPSKLRRTTIVGSRRMVVYDDTSTEPIRVFDSGVLLPNPGTFGEYRLTYRTGDIVSPRIDATEPLSLEMRDFCAAIRQGSALRSSPHLGLDVIRMIEAVDRSLTAGGAPVPVEASGAPTPTRALASSRSGSAGHTGSRAGA
jgi:predicted dehydrogenase